jgi:predicted ATPase
VFFIQPIGFIEPTAARRITQQESLEFGRCHRDEYARLGFELVEIPAGKIEARAALIDAYIRSEEVEVRAVVVPQEHDDPADDA